MTTNAELAAKLLREAATMFRSLGAPDPDLAQRLDEFAGVYEQVADLVEQNPRALSNCRKASRTEPGQPRCGWPDARSW